MKKLTINIPGFRIAAKTWGNIHAEPLIALHGWLDNANSFDLLAPYLSPYFYLIAVDLPGHGRSSHLPEGCYYHFGDGLFSLFQIIKALGYQKVHLLGHSMGACLASLAAGVYPKQLQSLMLIEGLGPFSLPEESCQEQLTNYIDHSLTKDPTIIRSYATREQAALARAKRGFLDLEYARILCQRSVVSKKGAYYWTHDRRLLYPSPLRLTEQQILSCLANIQCNTSLIWADKGFGFPHTLMTERVKTVQNISVAVLSGQHHIHMESPQLVAQELLKNYRF